MNSVIVNLDESAVKARCIDFLLSTQSAPTKDYVLINELPFADGKRRADLIEVNGLLNAYEIKSDLDTLGKLKEQIQDYKLSFDTVTIVITEKHLSKVQKMCAKNIGILLVGKGEVKLIRAAQKYKRFNNYYLASLLNIDKLNQLIKGLGIYNYSQISITDKRILVAKKIETSVLKQVVLDNLKYCYNGRYIRFVNNRGQKTMDDDIIELTSGSAGADRLRCNMNITSN